MQRVLSLLNASAEFEFVHFCDETLFELPVEQWPSVDVLLCFHSNGFPIRRASHYVRLENERRRARGLPQPLLQLQDVVLQRKVLLNRLQVYQRLTEVCNVPCPSFLVVKRSRKYRVVCSESACSATQSEKQMFSQTLDEVRLCDQVIRKPFVEKPIDSNNHHIVIYYAGGMGQRRLFRKQNNQSSAYVPDRTLPLCLLLPNTLARVRVVHVCVFLC
jgi:inositol-hexakisphosphate/diphosphoinositol-pentakisphosphate 1-kinase